MHRKKWENKMDSWMNMGFWHCGLSRKCQNVPGYDKNAPFVHRNLMKGLTQNSAVCLIKTNKSPTDTP